jgi:hypothetical protein
MINLMDHYEALLEEYSKDIERNLQIERRSTSDPYALLDRLLLIITREIARLKVQSVDIDLRIAQLNAQLGGNTTSQTKATPMLLPLPFVGAGDTFSLATAIVSYGFHSSEVSAEGYAHRWSGPSTHSGFVANFDRSAALLAEVQMKMADESINLELLQVDGESVDFQWQEKRLLKFVIPKIDSKIASRPTHVSLKLNKTLAVSDLYPGSSDTRRVGINISNAILSAVLDVAEA